MLPHFAHQWCLCMAKLKDNAEKAHAFIGLSLVLQRNPAGMVPYLPVFIQAIASWKQPPPQLVALLRQVCIVVQLHLEVYEVSADVSMLSRARCCRHIRRICRLSGRWWYNKPVRPACRLCSYTKCRVSVNSEPARLDSFTLPLGCFIVFEALVPSSFLVPERLTSFRLIDLA